MAQKIAEKPAEATTELRDKGAQVIESLREKGAEVVHESLDAVSHLAEEGQQRAGEVRDAVMERGNVLLDDLSAIYDSGKEFARRNPALVVGGAALAGYMLSRAMRAGPDHRPGAETGHPAKSSSDKSSSGATAQKGSQEKRKPASESGASD